MLTFVYDSRDQDFLPNVTDTSFEFVDYLTFESIPFYNCLASDFISVAEIGFYPIAIEEDDLYKDLISRIPENTLHLIRAGIIKILFYGFAEGHDKLKKRLIVQCQNNQISINNVKFITNNFLARNDEPFIFFCDAELRSKMIQIEKEDMVNLKVEIGDRSKKFSYINELEDPTTKLFSAILWQHGFHNDGFFVADFKDMGTDKISITKEQLKRSEIYNWNSCWENTSMLVEQFEMHAPFIENADEKKFYNDAYWSFIPQEDYMPLGVKISTPPFLSFLNLQPFVIVGSPHIVAILKHLGYALFGEFVDDSYDNMDDAEERMHRCFTLCYQLLLLDHQQHQALIHKLSSLLLHNQKRFLSKKNDVLDKIIRKLYA